MDAILIKSMGTELKHFGAEFDDCFGRREPRQNLRTYIRGQLSDLPRKSAEPIALAAKCPVMPQLREACSAAVPNGAGRRFFKKPLTGPLQTSLFMLHGSFSPRN